MGLTLGFIIALIIGSLLMSTVIGIGVQFAASEFDLGPLPRAFIGGLIIIPSVIMITIDFGILHLFPLLLLIYYIGTFQIGTKIGLAAGMEAPDDNDPPDIFFDMLNRYQ